MSAELLEGLTVLGDLFMLGVLVVVVRVGFKEKYLGIPILGFCVSFGWDITMTLFKSPTLNDPFEWAHFVIQVSWFTLDLVVLWQILRIGHKSVRTPVLKSHIGWITVATILLAVVGHLSYIQFAGDTEGVTSGLAADIILSISFVYFYFERPDQKGVSAAVGWLKLCSNLFIGVSFVLLVAATDGFLKQTFPLFLILSTILFDCIFVYLIHTHERRKGRLQAATVPASPAS